nr:hypothetical protein [Tanacetum cinerariifolium]
MKMVPHEAFTCPCGKGNVVMPESHKPHTRASKKRFWKEKRVRLLAASPRASTTPSYSPGPSTTPSYSSRPSTHRSYSLGPSENADCLNYKLLIGKIKVLEATLEMYMHSENHTLDSTALLHELYNDMGQLIWSSLSFSHINLAFGM